MTTPVHQVFDNQDATKGAIITKPGSKRLYTLFIIMVAE